MTTLGRGALLKVDLVISQGSDNDFWFRYGSAAAPVDLTGWTGRSQIRNRVGGDVMANFTVTLGNTAGTVEIHLLPAVSTAWPDSFKTGVWDLELVSASGIVTRFVEGKVKVDPDVTRS